jgi:hypothetical protein
LKFWSSLGPIATGDVELLVGAGDGVGVGVAGWVLWASAVSGAVAKAAAINTALARKIAFIRHRFSSERRSFPSGEQFNCPPRAEHSSIWRMNGGGTSR